MIRIIEGTETQVVETVQFPSIVGAEIEYGTILEVKLPLKRAKALMNLLFNETSLKKLRLKYSVSYDSSVSSSYVRIEADEATSSYFYWGKDGENICIKKDIERFELLKTNK